MTEQLFSMEQINTMAQAGMFAHLGAQGAAGQMGQKDVSLPPTNVPLYGPNGAFSRPGLNRGLVSAVISPDQGLRAVLPWRPSQYAQEVLGIITGMTASSGTNPTAACTPGPTPGDWKFCFQSWPFGQIKMSTKTIDLLQIGQLMNRGDLIDPVVMGNPFAEIERTNRGTSGVTARDVFKNEIKKEIGAMFYAMDADYHHLDTDGDAASTASNSPGAYKEYWGSQYIINTGYVDFYSRKACRAADSMILTAGGLDIATNAPTYVNMIVQVIQHLERLARQTGLAPVEFGFRMTYGAYDALANAWSCAYNTTACQAMIIGDGVQIPYPAMDATRMRDDMIQGIYQGRQIGPYLPIRGKAYPVIVEDERFFPESGTGPFTSEIEIWPLTSPKFTETDGAISYYEFYDWLAPYAAGEQLKALGNIRTITMPQFEVMRGGRTMLYSLTPVDTCIGYGAVERYRLVNRAPFLSARITNVSYTQFIHQRSSDPDSPFFYNGGNTSFAAYPQFQGYAPRYG